MAQIPGRGTNDNQLEPKSIKRSFPEVSEDAKMKEIVEEIPARAWWQVRLVHISSAKFSLALFYPFL